MLGPTIGTPGGDFHPFPDSPYCLGVLCYDAFCLNMAARVAAHLEVPFTSTDVLQFTHKKDGFRQKVHYPRATNNPAPPPLGASTTPRSPGPTDGTWSHYTSFNHYTAELACCHTSQLPRVPSPYALPLFPLLVPGPLNLHAEICICGQPKCCNLLGHTARAPHRPCPRAPPHSQAHTRRRQVPLPEGVWASI